MTRRLLLLAAGLAAGCDDKGGELECGEGTHESDGACVPEEEADADGDTDADGDSGSDADGDTDTDPCAPPDTWTGPIDSALYTSAPWDKSYDAGLADIAAALPTGSVSTSGGDEYLVYGATVVAVPDWSGDWRGWVWVADANATILLVNVTEDTAIGDKVGFAVSGLGARYDGAYIERTEGFSVLSSGNAVHVRDLGAEELDYYAARNEVVHAWGELTKPSSHDCDAAWGLTCYVFEHDEVDSLVRVDAANDWGLDTDYEGGLCAEIVAPIGHHNGSTGPATFFDVLDGEWMRVWSP